jgi:protein-tyrosine phosphatase
LPACRQPISANDGEAGETMLDKVIAIDGTSNLRDAGGYPAARNGRVRRRVLFRAEALVFPGPPTTASIFARENLEAYRALSLKTVIDLRGLSEANARPSAWAQASGAVLLQRPLDGGGEGDATEIMQRLRAGVLRVFTIDDLAEFYGVMLRRQAPMFGQALEALAAPDRLPALVHCAAGKDRTGVLIALVHEILGVSRDDIAEDYAMTEILRPNRVQAYLHLLEPVGIEPDAVRSLFEAPAEAIRLTLQKLDSDFGSVQDYLAKAAGVTTATTERLRERLIEAIP